MTKGPYTPYSGDPLYPELELAQAGPILRSFGGLVASIPKMEAITGFPLHKDAFFALFGNRVSVVRERAQEVVATCKECGKRNTQDQSCEFCGSRRLVILHIPKSTQEPPSAGWVISIGPEACLPSPGRSLGLTSEELLGSKVLFGAYAGVPIHVGDPGESYYEGRYMLVPSDALFGCLWQPEEPPLPDAGEAKRLGAGDQDG